MLTEAAPPPKLRVIYKPGYRGLLVSEVGHEGKPSDEGGSLIFARPIGLLLMYELGEVGKSHAVAGADSSAICFTDPDVDFEAMERQSQEELQKWYNPKHSVFLQCTMIDPKQRWCIG